MVKHILRGCLCAAFIGGLTGCGGPNIVPVSGQVKMNGQPLTGVKGFVRVEPADGRAAQGAIDPEDGTFSLTTYEDADGCLVGTHKAAVIANVSVGPKLIWLIPEKYANTKTSGLTVTIDEPTDSLTLELTGEVKQAPKETPEMFKGDDPGF